MAAAGDFEDEQTITFRAPVGWAANPRADASVHVLLLLEDNAAPRRIPLRGLPATIGRAAPAEIVLEGGTVSRRHCRLEQHGDNLVISDLGSTNGTLVNGARIDAPTPLNDGDAIAIGAHRLRYHRRSGDEIQVGPARFRVAA